MYLLLCLLSCCFDLHNASYVLYFMMVHELMVFRAQHDPRGGTPVPGYYETFQPDGHQVQERAVEMEAITAASQADDHLDPHRVSKF